MNLQSDENGLRYVFAVSAPKEKIRLKKVDNVPTEGLGHVIRCKRFASLGDVMGTMKGDNNVDDVELTVVPGTQNTLVKSNVDSENKICEETPSKKQISSIFRNKDKLQN